MWSLFGVTRCCVVYENAQWFPAIISTYYDYTRIIRKFSFGGSPFHSTQIDQLKAVLYQSNAGFEIGIFTSIHYGYQHFKLGIQIQKPVSKYKNISW